jgi:hypothetical protein
MTTPTPKPRPTIRSRQPCPVCGGREWVPLYEALGGLCDWPASNRPVSALIDLPCWHPCQYDRCASCGTVIA